MKPALLKGCFLLGRPFSPVYAFVMKTRWQAYDRGLLKSFSLPCPVISIGNIVMGGTGKTPHVIAVASFLKRLGVRPAVVSRGYGGRHGKEAVVVHDGRKLLSTPSLSGDEPVMIAQELGDVPVVVHKNRFKAGMKAVEEFGADLIVLDDGFQHLALKRDLDIVLLNSRCPFGTGRVFPGGDLREDTESLERADVIVFTKGEDVPPAQQERLKHSLHKKWPEKMVFLSKNRFTSLTPLGKDRSMNIESIAGRRILAFCGIANPYTFFDALKEFKAEIPACVPYPDHHQYRREDLLRLFDTAEKAGAELLVTTRKDGVKLQQLAVLPPSLPILQLNMEAVPEQGFFNALKTRLGV